LYPYIAYVELQLKPYNGFHMPKKEPRLSHQALKVLSILLQQPQESVAGSDILRQSGMLSGTIYPILMRFERARWLESEWEKLDASEMGRPRKRLYRLSPTGYNKARAALMELGLADGRPAWSY
jgi:DNA-binding PadR family transcriptional regulator